MKIKHQELMEDLFFRTNCAHLQTQVLQFLRACKDANIKTVEQALNEVQAYIDEQWEQEDIRKHKSLFQKALNDEK